MPLEAQVMSSTSRTRSRCRAAKSICSAAVAESREPGRDRRRARA
jgi:hypothetical protein